MAGWHGSAFAGAGWRTAGGRPRVGVVVHDLTAQKHIEDLLRQTRTRQDDAEASQRDSEGHYRALFEAMDEGFGVFEVIFDDQQRVADMRCIETNPSYERQGGRSQALGRTVRELSPDVESVWFDTYGKVALTGEPIRFTRWSAPRNMWFDVYAFRIGEPERRRIGVLFQNVTEQKQAEAALREKDARQEFLLALSDALRPLTDPVAVQAEASRVLAEHLGLSRALYCEVEARTDGNYYVARRDYHAPGVSSVVGSYRAADFGVTVMEDLSAGRTVAVADIDAHEGLTEAERNAFRATGIQAFVASPLIKNGRHVALFAVHHVAPRAWHRPRSVAYRGNRRTHLVGGGARQSRGCVPRQRCAPAAGARSGRHGHLRLGRAAGRDRGRRTHAQPVWIAAGGHAEPGGRARDADSSRRPRALRTGGGGRNGSSRGRHAAA